MKSNEFGSWEQIVPAQIPPGCAEAGVLRLNDNLAGVQMAGGLPHLVLRRHVARRGDDGNLVFDLRSSAEESLAPGWFIAAERSAS